MTSHSLELQKIHHMRLAINLARLGGRAVMPNPMVGAVITHNGTVIGTGYHQQYGGPHAEVHAVQSVTDTKHLKDSTMYVTLEPCSHFGKTPPCVDLILDSGIRHVVVGTQDPFPAVSGTGIEKLRAAGVRVEEGFLGDECFWFNRRFLTAHTHRRPYIILKWAETADGYIARSDYSSKWISCEVSRTLVHRWRADEMAILVGTRTALTDNPSLTVRQVHGVHPTRVVIDLDNKLPATANLLNDEAPTMVMTTIPREPRGWCSWHEVPRGELLLPRMLEHLYHHNLLSLIVEGGTATLQQFLDAGLWDEIRVFVSRARFREGIKAPSLGCLSKDNPSAVLPSGPDTLKLWFHPRLERYKKVWLGSSC